MDNIIVKSSKRSRALLESVDGISGHCVMNNDNDDNMKLHVAPPDGDERVSAARSSPTRPLSTRVRGAQNRPGAAEYGVFVAAVACLFRRTLAPPPCRRRRTKPVGQIFAVP